MLYLLNRCGTYGGGPGAVCGELSPGANTPVSAAGSNQRFGGDVVFSRVSRFSPHRGVCGYCVVSLVLPVGDFYPLTDLL